MEGLSCGVTTTITLVQDTPTDTNTVQRACSESNETAYTGCMHNILE